MIQSALFFILGFLCAGFIALLVAPAVWRRAVALTRRRIEASMPLSLNEMRAETDKARAEAAMSIRRLEISVKSLKEKAANQLIELNRSREELRRLGAETAGKSELIAGLEAGAAELRAKLGEAEQGTAELSGRLAEAEDLIEKRAAEFQTLERTYEDTTFLSTSRQIEIAGRESEIEKMSIDLSRLRSQRKDMERRMAELSADNEAVRESLKNERKRSADLDKKVEQMLSRLTDREETLGRRESELARLRQRSPVEASNQNGDGGRPTAQKAEAVPSGPQPAAAGADGVDDRLARLSAERERLESRLTTLTRENRKLRQRNGSGEDQAADGMLREEIHRLAAEVVSLTSMLDGPDSPIGKALSAGQDGTASPDRFPSLSERIRALQKAASGD